MSDPTSQDLIEVMHTGAFRGTFTWMPPGDEQKHLKSLLGGNNVEAREQFEFFMQHLLGPMAQLILARIQKAKNRSDAEAIVRELHEVVENLRSALDKETAVAH